MTTTNNLTKGFKAIAIIAILWNVIGVLFYLMHAYMSAETIATLPQNQQDYMNTVPAWRTGVFAIATFTGLIASVFLLMKKKLASCLFIVSLLAIIAGDVYDFFMIDHYKGASLEILFMPILVLLIGIFLVLHTRKMKLNEKLS